MRIINSMNAPSYAVHASSEQRALRAARARLGGRFRGRLWPWLGSLAAVCCHRYLTICKFKRQGLTARHISCAADNVARRVGDQRKAAIEDRLIGNAAQETLGL